MPGRIKRYYRFLDNGHRSSTPDSTALRKETHVALPARARLAVHLKH